MKASESEVARLRHFIAWLLFHKKYEIIETNSKEQVLVETVVSDYAEFSKNYYDDFLKRLNNRAPNGL